MCLTVDTSFIFKKKNQMLLDVFLISPMLRWYNDIKNHKNWTLKVNFCMSKTSKSPNFFLIEEYQFKTIFFANFDFKVFFFTKMTS